MRAHGALLFSGFRLEEDGSLFRGGSLIHLPPRELAALRLLLENAGQIVTTAQLKKALWDEVHVTADSVTKCLSSLRSRLQPDESIQTIYKRGYRLVADVRTRQEAQSNALPRLAIPPFTTDTGVPDHLGSALAEDAIARLSNVRKPFASMLARESVFTLATRGMTGQQIGETLNADLVLAGTMRALSSHFRLRVEMIRIADGIQIWVEDLLAERDSVDNLEADLADRLDFRLRPERNEDEQSGRENDSRKPATLGAALTAARTANEGISITATSAEEMSAARRREAYDAYLRGHHEWQTLERHRMQDGLQLLIRATELDPSLMVARVDLAQLAVGQGFYGYMSSRFVADVVQGCAASVSDFSAEAAAILPSLGWVQFHFDRNLNAAVSSFRSSAHLPHNPWITRARSMFALSRGQFSDAMAMTRSAIEQDPYSPWLHARLAWTLHLDGQAEASVKLAELALEMFPGHVAPILFGSMVLSFNGKAARAVELTSALEERQPHFDLVTAAHAYALACHGKAVEARALLDRLHWLSGERFVTRAFNPAVFVALGDLDAAIAELQAVNLNRCPWFFQILADPRLKPLHRHAEFKKLQGILAGMEESAKSGDSGL